MRELLSLYGLVGLGVFILLYHKPKAREDFWWWLGSTMADFIVAALWPYWVGIKVWRLATGR